jgi:hypothetical protein
MSSITKILNYLALILLIAQSSTCISLKMAEKSKAEAATKLKEVWPLKYQFKINTRSSKEQRNIDVFRTLNSCENECLGKCYAVSTWEDLYKNIKYADYSDYVCVMTDRKAKNIFTNPNMLREQKKSWIFEDLCNAYCQARFNVKCVAKSMWGKDAYQRDVIVKRFYC